MKKNIFDKKISIIGLGYIGLPTAIMLASSGFKVYGNDVKEEIINKTNSGELHFVEDGLSFELKKAVESNMLISSLEIVESDIYIICVPTPFYEDKEIPTPNIEYVLDASEKVAKKIKKGDMVILESTSPIGTTKKIEDILKKSGVDTNEIHIAYCPERVIPGNIYYELKNNSRIIGGLNKISTEKVANFYKNFVKGEIHTTDAATAEMCKLTENSFRDVNIAFANELSIICDENNINVRELIRLANNHPRVNILNPGTGVGGHCIAVDPWFIVSNNPKTSNLIKMARQINDNKPAWVARKILERLKKLNLNNVVCLGASFKPDIDDLRGSPAIEVLELLTNNKINVSLVEPNISSHPKYKLIDINSAVESEGLFIGLVSHKQFLNIDFKKQLNLKGDMFIDFSGIIEN